MRLLATARALAYLGSARFDSHLHAEVADQFSGLGGADLDRLVQNSRPTPLDKRSQPRPTVDDIMAHDSDGGTVLPFQLRGYDPESPTGGSDE